MMRDARDEGAPSVACIVLNWNGWPDTLACLDSLAHVEHARLEIIVVDNGSTDDSVRRISQAYPRVALLKTGANLGFGAGTNVGLRRALAEKFDYVWLLNNDARPQPAALAALLAKACSNPRLGAIGSKLLYAHDPSKVQAWGGGRINRWTGRAVHATSAQDDDWFDYITAASTLLPRRALEETGVFDESFFLYWEDADLSVRLLERGWVLGVAAESIVLHKENASSGGDRRIVDRYSTTSGIRFLSKHARAPWISIPLFLTLRIGKRLLSGQFARVQHVLAGVRDYRVLQGVGEREGLRVDRG
jgi:GT2 family glycosyltransferase